MRIVNTRRRPLSWSPLRAVFTVTIVAALAACEQLPLYNKEKDKLAESALKAYTGAKVTEALDIQEENLKTLLKAEIAALNESASLRLDIALLRMSDDRPTKNGSTSLAGWYDRAEMQIQDLGFGDNASVLKMMDHRIEVEQAIIQLETVKARIGAPGSKALPSCKAVRNDDLNNLKWKYAASIKDAFKRSALMIDYREYVQRCQEALKPPPVAISGRIATALNERLNAEAELRARQGKAKSLAAEVKEKTQALKKKKAEATEKLKAVTDAKKKLDNILKGHKQDADDLLQALKELREVAGGEGADLIAEKNIEAINAVLAAVGSGQANAEGLKDPRLKVAVTMIRTHIPSLAADMAALLDRARAPPVSNLILELQHQIIEQKYAKALIALSEKRIEVLRARYRTLVDATGAWRGFRLALRNFALLSANKPDLRAKCDTFIAKPKNRDTAECALGTDPAVVVNDCVLKLTWRLALNGPARSRQKRELYSALYQYAEAFEAERLSRAAEFHLADLDHREALAAQRSGIEAWSNLVAVPMGQLAAYHASGIKPEAIADFIATIIGMTAIGVGAAQ